MEKPGRSRRTVLKYTGAGLGLSTLPALASGAGAAQSVRRHSMTDLTSAAWTFRQAGSGEWLSATVPGTVHTDLLANGKIADPFYRTNEKDQQWIDKEDWEYRAMFNIAENMLQDDHVELVFAGLDTYAEVFVNDTQVLAADNMFREWRVDVKPQLKPGANEVRIYFHSPIKEGLKRLKTLGYNLPATNDQSENGGVGDDKLSVFTRKAGYHYGWDWGPRFVTSGIWRPVTLSAWSNARLADLHVVQDTLTADKAQLTAVVEIEAVKAGPAVLTLESATDSAIRGRAETVLVKGLNTVRIPVTIGRPKLWWSNGLGEAFMYALKVNLVTGNGQVDSRQTSVGLRTLAVRQTPDKDGTSFYIELNGVPVFMKGANYIPCDSFLPRVGPDVYERVVRSVVDTHMNMIRVWGGGVYEDNRFYDLCDRHGILVWQDFMFACSMYPGDAGFLDNVRQEAIQNVRRLRNHPSLALWVGNNEIDAAWQNDMPNGGWGWKQKYTDAQREQIWDAYKAIFLEILPSVVADHDPQRFYWSSSPLAAGNRHADLGNPLQSGDIHYWDVWWGQKPFSEYRTHIGRFMSEYGFQSFPEFKTVASYTEPSDRDIFSEVMQAHQRSSIGNGTIKNYMQRDYRVPADFKQFLYVGQVLQAEGIKVAMEAHRSRMPYCMGSLFWQINDCWPVASWSSVDYYGRWKAQQYFARNAFRPVLVSPVLENGMVTVTVASDLHDTKSVELLVEVLDFTGRMASVRRMPIEVPANSARIVFRETVANLLADARPDSAVMTVKVSDRSQVIAENTLYFVPVKDLNLPQPLIQIQSKSIGGEIALGLTSAHLVKNLYLDVEGADGSFSDNFFDLLPNRTVVVRYKPTKALGLSVFKQALTLTHMAQIA